ncbi:MAG TPA: hypothetical protein VFC09_05685 [Candidatus Dormibacteraeota bacterium]|nr:hypothetical protein [Candidatus Dormibacteraeota bacterium]
MATAVVADRARRGGRRMGLVYALMSALLVLALVPALHPPLPHVPPIAAFAPVAQQNITKPPPDQSSTSGKGANQNGNGEAAGGSATPTPSPTPPAPPAAGAAGPGAAGESPPRSLDCVDGPGGPRQIADTQSPPCIPFWKGDNGGATWHGVDANTIRIGLADSQPETQYWTQFFNDHFELYGRQIVTVNVGCGGGGGSDTPQADMVKDADQIAATDNVFAVLGCSDAGGREKYFFDELARKGIISVTAQMNLSAEADLEKFQPYEWNYYPSVDVNEVDLGAQACTLRDQPAPAYTPPSLSHRRSYGIIYSTYTDGSSIDRHYLTDALQACGITVQPKDILPVDYVPSSAGAGYQNRSTNSTQQAEAAVAQLASDGITTVLFMTHVTSTIQVLQQADSASYHPEWMMGYFDYNTAWSPEGPLQPTDQWDHAFGFDYQNKLVAAPLNPWYQAVMEENSTYSWPYAPLRYNGWYCYEMELLLASGLQMAGPHLTPQTFQQGLWNTHFPNPPGPYDEGTVGFNHDHTWVKDHALVWYSASSTGPWGQSGVWCYVTHGQRYTDANLPGGYPYDSGTCEA